ncbi:MAG: type I glutamate--ammonia ligase [Candidatus Neomarinimicrobiota bacterium]|nr:MAG: type I glutamate--ammonia ligase [Candidatus Neomarinimicrobiota bacterium]
MTAEEILKSAREQNIRFVDMQFTDLPGILKAVTIPVSKLPEVLENNIWFDGSSIEGFTRIFESDMYLKPDLNTWAAIPWTQGTGNDTARLICDVYLPDGKLYAGSPRSILERQLDRAAELGFTYNVGPELEFFLFRKENGVIRPLPHDKGGYFDQTTDLATTIRQDMTQALQELHIDVEALHHEVAAGQHEIDFRYGDALTVADNAITFKYAVKSVAHQHGLHATFMPKPIAGINGSGMHVHQSLFQGDQNVFYDAQGKYHLSDTARYFIGGQLHHARALAAILNPTVNSYKRLVPGFEAPVYISWANTNRSALIRIPRYTPGRENSTRCELRCADPSSNPYLVFTVMLAAGLDGIERKLEPPQPLEENIFALTEADLKLKEIATLPVSLREAIDELLEDEVICTAIGETALEAYTTAKRAEWQGYAASVSQWELDTYLEIL